MATAKQRPGEASPKPLTAAPDDLHAGTAQRLRSHNSHHVRDAVLLAGAGIACAGAAPIVGYPGLQAPVLVAALAGSGVLLPVGALRQRRQDLHDRLIEALAPSLAPRAGRLDIRTVKILGWTLGWPGSPRRLRLRYAPDVPSADPKWVETILTMLQMRTLERYEVTKHDHRRCTLMLQLKQPEPETPETPQRVAHRRAEQAIQDLIGATARVQGAEFNDDGALTRIEVAHNNGTKLAVRGYRTRVEATLSAMLPGRWRAHWDLEGDSVVFERRPELPGSVWMPTELPMTDLDDLLANYRKVEIPIALDEDGKNITWHPARIPHLMITGSTGTGKTATIQAIVAKFTQFGWPVMISDAKRVEFLDFRDWPNVQLVAGSVEQQVALIHRARALMEYRYELIETGRATLDDFEPLLIVLDEFTEFRANVLNWYPTVKRKGDPTKPECLGHVASLARKSRTAAIHLILSTQRPDAEFVGGEMRDNFGMRASIGRLSPQGATMMWDNYATGVALPRGVRQRAMVTGDGGLPVEAQCFRFPGIRTAQENPGSEEAAIVDALRPTRSNHPRFVIVPPEPELDKDGNEIPASYTAWANAEWDLAENRPDLDALAQAELHHEADGRVLSSTMASLGLLGEASARLSRNRAPAAMIELAEPMAETDEAGYAPASVLGATELRPGDLIQIDPDIDEWVTVEEVLTDDGMDDDEAEAGLITISWRSDDDEDGVLQLDHEEALNARRPTDEALDQEAA